MNIGAINKYMAAIQPIRPKEIQETVPTQPSGKSFGEMLSQAIKETDESQKTADKKVEELVMGKDSSPHEAMIALEKADVAFQLMNQVRSKIIRAYDDIIRTQV